ncbi:hypothetical protein OSB04_000130 [Centaurea solstitialis]|uniref:F-box domain-containing protein n=1 Tax=Centaurea solstitialis TaxID=347529 RepID=A0AA38TNM1_9ASTR|nr:hypothetical protein OSB04_000130 [Centaurea solstitialis]
MDTILCDELLQEIFHRLPPPSSSAVSLVSKRWLRLLRSSLSSLSLHLSPNHHHHHPSLSTFLSHHTYLSSLSLSSTTTTTTTAVSDDLLTTISAAVPNLTRLRISTGPVSFLPLLSLSTSSPNLQSLSLILHRNHLSFHFLTYFQSLKNLTVILTGNSPESSQVTEFHSPKLLRLQSLSLSGIRSGDHELAYLWRNCDHETLTKLAFENCDGVGDNFSFSSFINGVKNLQELELKTSRSIASSILIKLAENSTRSSSLKSLLIYDGGSKDGFLHFLLESRCNNLQKLDLRLPLDLTDNHLSQIGSKFNKLRVLRLQSCSMVTGEGFKSLGFGLSQNNKNLEELSLTNCDSINRRNGILVELAQNLRNVKVLDLSYNHMLIDKEFESMISSYRDLKKLKVRGCSRLTNSSLIAICKKCRRLESIDLVFCHGIEIEGVEFVILNSPELRKLQVEDRKVSEASRRWMKSKFIEMEP